MKRLFTLLFMLSTVGLFGQLKLAKVSLSANHENDMVKGLSFNYFEKLVPHGVELGLDSGDFGEGNLVSRNCDNSSTVLGISLINPVNPKWEYRFGVYNISNKIDAVSYENLSSEAVGKYITFNARFDEIGGQFEFLRKSNKRVFNWYLGAGLNFGMSYNNDLCVFGSDETTADDISFRTVNEVRQEISADDYGYETVCFNTKNHTTSYLYLIAGMSVTVWQKVELGMEIYGGGGQRSVPGFDSAKTNIGGLELRLSYLF